MRYPAYSYNIMPAKGHRRANLSTAEYEVEEICYCLFSSCLIFSHFVVSTVTPPAHLQMLINIRHHARIQYTALTAEKAVPRACT